MNTPSILTRLLGAISLLTLGAIGASLVLTRGYASFPNDEAVRTSHTATSHNATPNWPHPSPPPMADGADAFVVAAASSVDAVVHVQTASPVAEVSNPWLNMLGMTAGRIAQGSGSGVLIDKSGIVVTNHHVIDGAREVRVNTSDGASYVARVVGSDPSTDLAVLEIDAERPLPAMDIGNSDRVQVGEWVLAVGNPLNLTSTVTAGIISAKGRNIRLLQADASKDIYPVESFLQTDAAVNPGNSGGALVNLEGKLIGINTAIASQTGSYAGYSFAIPSSIVSKVVKDIREFGRVQRAYMGIQVDARETGVVVGATTFGGGAAAAGMEAGDRILALDGIDVRSFPALQEQLSKHRPGDVVALQVRRGDVTRALDVTLTDRAGDVSPSLKPEANEVGSTSSPALSISSLQQAWGISLGPVSDQTRQALRIRGGVMVTSLRNGPWSRQGIRKGFIVLRIDGTPVSCLEDICNVVERAARQKEDGLLLEGVYADGTRGFAGVAVPDVRP